MKKLKFLFILLIIISCNSKNNEIQNDAALHASEIIPLLQKSTANVEVNKNNILALEFRNFRDAVYQGKQNVVKTYIDFPISGNSIGNESIPVFLEENFEKEFKLIFPKEFINAVLKIKSEKLFKDGAFETEQIKNDAGGSYKCYAIITEGKILQVNIALNETVYDAEGNLIEDAGEYNYIYEFEIRNNKLKLKSRILAG
jgi:hypothetical protein